MSATTPPAPTPPEPTAPGARRRSAWMWVSAGLAVVAVALLAWGLSLRSDRDDAEAEVAALQQRVEAAEQEGDGPVREAVGGLVRGVVEQIGAANQDLATTNEKIAAAEQAGAQAREDVEAAKARVSDAADDARERADAIADQARAEADAAASRASIAADCARAYVQAIGAVFGDGNVVEQIAGLRGELTQITDRCRATLQGA